jgi:hypothetical protein
VALASWYEREVFDMFGIGYGHPTSPVDAARLGRAPAAQRLSDARLQIQLFGRVNGDGSMKPPFEDHVSTFPAVQERPATPSAPRRMTLNMGPQHPSTHGVLRIVIELEGETIVRAEPDIGFLHTGIEKQCEAINWQQVVTLTDRVIISRIFRTTGLRADRRKLLQLRRRPPSGCA